MKKAAFLPPLVLSPLLLAFSIANAADHEIKMLNNGTEGLMVFEPGYLHVDPGDTITFVPVDQGHNTVSEFVPEGAEGWSSEISANFSVTLDVEGIYIYKCLPHAALAMAGVIEVGTASNTAEANEAADNLSATFAVNKERLGKYLAQAK